MQDPTPPTRGDDAPFPVDAAGLSVVVTTAPPGVAQDLARRLVDEGLAACVNVVPGLRSIYRWQGEVQDDPETLLLIKTRTDRLPELSRRIADLHPYEVPEQLVLDPAGVSAEYLAWLEGAIPGASETGSKPLNPGSPAGR